MLDGELLAERQIEFVLVDQRLGEMRGQLRIAYHSGERARAEALVADGIALGHAEGKGRVLVEAEIGDVIVVDHDGHIRLDFRQPFTHGHIGVEQRLPCRLLRAAAIDHRANRGHMRQPDAPDDACHQVAPLILRVARNSS